jgi:hypothetical protein
LLHIRLRKFSHLEEKKLSQTINSEDETEVDESFSLVTGLVTSAAFPGLTVFHRFSIVSGMK